MWDHDGDADPTLIGVTLPGRDARNRRVGVGLHHGLYPRNPDKVMLDITGRVRGLELPADTLIAAVVALWPGRIENAAWKAGFEAGQRDALGHE